MKFMIYSRPSTPSVTGVACHLGSGCLDITKAIAAGVLTFPAVPTTLEEILAIAGGLDDLEDQISTIAADAGRLTSYVFPESEVNLKAPIRHPEKLIGIGLNYKDHAEEVKARIPQEPLLFGMYPNAIIGPNEAIVLPAMSKQVDYEAELGVIMGTRAKDIAPEDVVRHVAGYTIIHDVSARDLQFADKQWVRAKSFDTFAPMGPYLVTRRSLNDGDGLAIQSRLNGKTMQHSNTSNMIFKVPAIISHISKVMTLQPGDVIATGTPAGVGFVRNPQVFLKPGDVVEIEIEGIGVLRNPVVGCD